MVFMQLYPLLLAFPAGTVLARERQLGISTLIEARTGNASYVFAKVLASFAATAIVFSVPFLVEIILTCLAFPLRAEGDFLQFSLYDPEYKRVVSNYLFPGIYRISPYLYAVIHTLVVGICSGIMGAFVTALSSVTRLKYRFLYLLPPFLALGAMEYVRGIIAKYDYRYAWFNYVCLFSEYEKSRAAFALFFAVLAVAAICLTIIGSRRDCL
jgi:hypothetical protein